MSLRIYTIVNVPIFLENLTDRAYHFERLSARLSGQQLHLGFILLSTAQKPHQSLPQHGHVRAHVCLAREEDRRVTRGVEREQHVV